MNFEKAKKYEEKIKKLLIDPKQMNEIVKPVSAFITFESESATNEAINYKKWLLMQEQNDLQPVKDTIFNKVPDFKRAPEPSNIIWENKYIKEKQKFKNYMSGMFKIVLLILVTFTGIVLIKKLQINYLNGYK